MDKHAVELFGAAKYGPYSAGVEAGDMSVSYTHLTLPTTMWV